MSSPARALRGSGAGAGIIYWELATGQSPDGRRLRRIECGPLLQSPCIALCACIGHCACTQKHVVIALPCRRASEAPEGVIALIQRCLSEDPALRPTAVECVQALTRLAEV